MHLSSSDRPPTCSKKRHHGIISFVTHSHCFTIVERISVHVHVFIKQLPVYELISWKSLKKKNFFKKKMQRFICKKNAHGFEPIKLLCVYIYVPTILYWLDLPQKNSSSWQNLVENLHQDKLKHLNCWQFIHNFSKSFFFFLSRVMQWCSIFRQISWEKSRSCRSKEF